MRIEIVVFDGFDELDALGPFEVLMNAAAAGADFSVNLASWSQKNEVVGAHGLRLSAEIGLPGGPRPDLVVVPGGGWIDRNPLGARAEVERGVIPSRLAELHQAGDDDRGRLHRRDAACVGGTAARSGGDHAPRSNRRFAGGGCRSRSARVVDDGEFVTCGGVTSGLDLALWLVERFAGPAVAHTVEREMEYERRGVVWRRPANLKTA